jgi:hypothetical protein
VTSPRLATLLRLVTIFFVTAWAVRSLIVSGDQVLNEPFKSVLVTPPWVTQARSGDGFEQSLIRIRTDLPASDRVIVIWTNPPDYYYAYFWSTFWLFPRRVSVVSGVNTSQEPDAEALMDVRRPFEPQPTFPGFSLVAAYSYPDYVVTTYRRNG